MAEEDPQAGGGGSGTDDVRIRTFLIADVRGYTLFTQERGDEGAGKLAAKFARIARELVASRGGTLLELRGDEALCVFGSTRQAIRAAVDLQERFVEETLADPELPLTVGIGLDAGEAVEVEGGYRGGALNLAARLCGQARAGEILASREVTHLARRVDGVTYQDRGSLSLKGLDEPVGVVRVVPDGDDAVTRLSPYAPIREPERPRRRRPPWPALVAGVLVVILIAVGLPLLLSGEGTIDIGTNSMARISAADGSLAFATELGQRPGASAIGFGSLWIAEPDEGIVVRLDLEDGSVTDRIPVGSSPAGVAVGGGSVWVTNAGDGTVSRIPAGAGEVTQKLNVGAGPSGIAFGDGALWVADSIGGVLVRVDPNSGTTRPVPLSGQPSGVAFTPDGVWVSLSPAGISRVDPSTMTVTFTEDVGSGPTAVLPAFGSIWVANHLDGTVTRLEPSTGKELATIHVGDDPNALGAAAGSIWVANGSDDSISEIDPATDEVQQTLPVGGTAASLTARGDGLWLAVGASATEHRGGTLTIASQRGALTSIDPALAYDITAWQVLTITNDGLLAYRSVGGPEGASLVPDLASALPQVSPDGLTYRFPLREGIRYSTGEPVRPEDFRHGFERSFSLSIDAASIYRAIGGAGACAEDPSTCDLRESIVADAEAVTFHLKRPDPDLPFKLTLPFAFPVPAGIPAEDQGLVPVPATGPYMVAEAGEDGLELVRNPEFREWSGTAQPDGFVDAISWMFDEEAASAFDRLSDGDLDWMADPPEPDDLASLKAQHPDQVVLSLSALTLFVGFDVNKPPFDDVRVRQALNYAIDRDRVVELLGGPTSHRTTCQILPPSFQGYVPFCPYTLEPDDGVWSATDLERARALIEEADAVGKEVIVWVMTEDPLIPDPAGTMQYVVEVLDEVGLRAHLRIVEPEEYFGVIYAWPPPDRPGDPHVYLSGWGTDYLRAGDFIESGFRCGANGNASGLCNQRLDARIDEAKLLQLTDPAGANAAWSEIEHRLVEDAVWAPISNPVAANAFSARVGNIQVHLQWGVLLSRLWVK
jgi:ABC-type transport system substrate-binding protein/class 3 adenylate cyclase/DNA-binding beta-propeller fold protein YncE